MSTMDEAAVEKHAIDLLVEQGYAYIPPEQQETEREGRSAVLLRSRLVAAIERLNPTIPRTVGAQALRQVTALSAYGLVEGNEALYQMLVEGVAEEYQRDGETVGARVRLIDFKDPRNNDYAVCNQFIVEENNRQKRPDVVVFINGLPLVVFELKSPEGEHATVRKAFSQLQTYKEIIPSLFCYNGLLVISDGFEAKAGSLTSGWSRFMAWKTVDGRQEDSQTTPQLRTLIRGMLRPDVLLSLVRHFSLFESAGHKDSQTGQIRIRKEKKIAAYHQYHAVREAVKSTIRASIRVADTDRGSFVMEAPEGRDLYSVRTQPKGDRKAGIVWHTQGSGKSLSMVFYAGLLVASHEMHNPTIVVLTDRNDLDDQLFDAFVAGKTLLRQEPKQAENRTHLKQLLKTAGGGVVFSTIQKFNAEDGSDSFECLSDRTNIVVIADEAHRSQYGFGMKTSFANGRVKTNYGFAKYVRDALPNASFIGFTGTPIEREDISTPAVFGNYIDIYDIEQAIEDAATKPIFYTSRLVEVHLKEEEKAQLDAEVDGLTENEETTATEKEKAKWARQEAIIGQRSRIQTVITDILGHFEQRRESSEGKAMIVAASRRIAVAMYAEIIAQRPNWHADDKSKGTVKIVMTSSASDPIAWQQHTTSKKQRKELGERFKNPADPLAIVIVRDMWLTGFDIPCLDTIYVDKIMRGHNLMQAIARVNRIYKDKPGGLVVDYIGIASDLRQALAAYTRNGGRGTPAFEQERAIESMLEKFDVVTGMFANCSYTEYFQAAVGEKMELILKATEHILGLSDGKERFITEVTLLSKAFALSVPSRQAMEIRADVGFFQAIKTRLAKFGREGGGLGQVEIETAIRQIVDRAIVVDGVIDVFDAAGMKKPDISILSDDFLAEIQGMTHKNLALELLKKILGDEIKSRITKNFVQGHRFSEMLTAAIRRYKNNLLNAAQIIGELIQIAQQIKDSDERAADMGLSEEEVAFYDALAMNKSAQEVMGDTTLKALAQELVITVKRNTSIDWMAKESARAKLRSVVKRLLNKYGYPPDKQQMAADGILKQTELRAGELLAS